jgi:DNA-binding phage protein
VYRTECYDSIISKKLQSPEYAKCYLLSSMEDIDGDEGLDLMPALKEVISMMGIKEFSKLSGIKPPNISRFLGQDQLPKVETLNNFLAHFELRAKVSVEGVA